MIPAFAISLLAVAGFGSVLWWVRIVPVARGALGTTLSGLSSMLDSALDDDAKETAARRAGLALIGASFGIFWRFGAAIAAAAAPVLLADSLGLVSGEAVVALMLRLDYIVLVSVAAIGIAELVRRRRPAVAGTAQRGNQYSATDRFFHALAFSSPAVLRTASSIEDRIVSQPTKEPSGPPIFVTSLARGGTTALLNALNDIDGVATHTYRDMPFLTAPVLWHRLSGGRERAVDRQQRAHGDGLEIDLDSPEAFEEVIWKMFWPEKYGETAIDMWRPEDRRPDAERFLERHMRKVIRARLGPGTGETGRTARYCSKNNASIGRLSYLAEAMPGCQIVVPVRRPECHAASLLRQHLNFAKRQADDAFTMRYMRDIGHFDFGLIHKPIRFLGFDPSAHDPSTGDYWLGYWIGAFRTVLDHRDRCIIVTQDDLRRSPEASMARLCGALDLPPRPGSMAGHFRSDPDRSPSDRFDRHMYEEASDLYRTLAALALTGAGSHHTGA